MRELLTLDHLASMTPDAAAALLVYRRADGAGDLDPQVLGDWLRLDPANQAAWDNAQSAWADFGDGEGDEILDALRADARKSRPQRLGWIPLAVAAAVVLTIGGALTIFPHAAGEGSGKPAASSVAYATAEGEQKAFSLKDGTQMTLGSGSAATVTLTAKRRDVKMSHGRIEFAVARDAARPFVVRAADQEIVALGTQFEVQLRPSEVRVALREGRVSVRRVTGQAQATLLRPGQALIARDGEGPHVSLLSPPGAREDVVDFDNVTLAEAAKVLSARGDERLIVRDPAVATLRIRGRFKAGDLPRFGRSLALVHPVQLVRRGPGVWEIVPAR